MEDTFTSLLGDNQQKKKSPLASYPPEASPAAPAPVVTAIHGAPEHVQEMVRSLHSGGSMLNAAQNTEKLASEGGVPTGATGFRSDYNYGSVDTDNPGRPNPDLGRLAGTSSRDAMGGPQEVSGAPASARPAGGSVAEKYPFPSAGGGGGSTSTFPSTGGFGSRGIPNAGAAASAGMGIFNEALGEAKTGDRQRVGALAVQDEQGAQKRAMENWMSAENIRHHGQADDFYNTPAGANVFKGMYPGMDTSGVNPGTHAIYDQAEKNREARAGELVKGGGAMWGDQGGVPTPEHKAWNDTMGIPEAPPKAPVALAKPAGNGFGNAMNMGRAAVESAAPVAGWKLAASKLGPVLGKIPRVGKILQPLAGIAGAAATGGLVNELDPGGAENIQQHPWAALLGGLSPLAMHKGVGGYTGKTQSAAPSAPQTASLSQHANGPVGPRVFPGTQTSVGAGTKASPKVVPSPGQQIPVQQQFGSSGSVPIKQPPAATPPPVGAGARPSMSNVPTSPPVAPTFGPRTQRSFPSGGGSPPASTPPTSPTAAFGPRTARPSLGAPRGGNAAPPLTAQENAALHDYFMRLGIPMARGTQGMSPDQLRQLLSLVHP